MERSLEMLPILLLINGFILSSGELSVITYMHDKGEEYLPRLCENLPGFKSKQSARNTVLKLIDKGWLSKESKKNNKKVYLVRNLLKDLEFPSVYQINILCLKK